MKKFIVLAFLAGFLATVSLGCGGATPTSAPAKTEPKTEKKDK